MKRLAFLLIAVLLVPSPAPAQDAPPWRFLPPWAIAVTWCDAATKDVRTAIDAEVLGADSTQEILVHEAKHREQQRRTVKQTGACPVFTVWRVLQDEVEAYCASRALRERRTSRAEANEKYKLLLGLQFGRIFPQAMVDSAYDKGCP